MEHTEGQEQALLVYHAWSVARLDESLNQPKPTALRSQMPLFRHVLHDLCLPEWPQGPQYYLQDGLLHPPHDNLITPTAPKMSPVGAVGH